MEWFSNNWIFVVVLLVCIGMHLFGHGHGGHGSHDEHESEGRGGNISGR